jgi:hypothetical protein
MKTVELFCGLKSFSNVAKTLGHDTFTVDIDDKFSPNLCRDILQMYGKEFPTNIDVLWASPPCETFSIASCGHHWHPDKKPKTRNAEIGLQILERTIYFIYLLKPKIWFIENPRGLMRKKIDEFFNKYGIATNRYTVTYCQYGDTRMKPTDIWTNAPLTLKPMCKNGDKCHESAPRGSKTGTQGIKTYEQKSRIPEQLFYHIFEQIDPKRPL